MPYIICNTCQRGYDSRINKKCKYCHKSKPRVVKINNIKKGKNHAVREK